MNRLEAELRVLASSLDATGASYALVGGMAVSVRTEPRFTRDIDVAVAAADDAEAEGLVQQLADRYFVESSFGQEAASRLAGVRLRRRGEEAGGVVVDVLFASSGIEPELVGEAERIELLPGLHVPVAAQDTSWRSRSWPRTSGVHRTRRTSLPWWRPRARRRSSGPARPCG